MNLKNILFYILESVILAAFVIFILICFFFLLSPSFQWRFLFLLIVVPLILAFFAIIEGSYDIYISILNKKKYSSKPKETKKHFISIIIFIMLSLVIWNFNLYLKDANYLVFTLMVIPYLKEKNEKLIKDIFIGFFLYFILYILLKEIEPIIPNFFEPFNKYIYYSYENYSNILENENWFFIYTLFKASLFSKFYLVIIRIINKLHKDSFIKKENINQN